MKRFIYLTNPHVFVDNSSWIGRIDKVDSKVNLLNRISVSLQFPDYFGFNWDALYDCLRDFHWIKHRNIIIIHDDIPILDDQVLKIYVNVLYDAINDWQEGEDHVLDVIFPKQYEQKIESLIARMNP